MSESDPLNNVDPDVLDWQIREIKKGLEEADRGEFATDEEMAEVFARFGIRYPRNFPSHS